MKKKDATITNAETYFLMVKSVGEQSGSDF